MGKKKFIWLYFTIFMVLNNKLLAHCQLVLENNTQKTILIVPLLPKKAVGQTGGIIVPAYGKITLGTGYRFTPEAYAFYEQNPRTNQFTLYHTLYERDCNSTAPILYGDIEKNYGLNVDIFHHARLLIDKR
ncbi:MAG TPA: hypothetical protein VHA52_07975 [Candidatus Babeliaceae bacterium]|nr:hypothetical protein [Candidatus Babeliaceae bacterium]